jgi:hypothetical protein
MCSQRRRNYFLLIFKKNIFLHALLHRDIFPGHTVDPVTRKAARLASKQKYRFSRSHAIERTRLEAKIQGSGGATNVVVSDRYTANPFVLGALAGVTNFPDHGRPQ